MLGVSGALVALAGGFQAARAQDFIRHLAFEGEKRLTVANETAGFFTSSLSFVNVTTANVVIPATFDESRIVARFSAESLCTASSWCSVRILVDGVEMNPVVGTNFAFDSPGDEGSGNMIERTSGVVASGTHVVAVQAAIVGSSGTLSLDDWQLTLEVWKAS
jgi:hypothetical protein